MTDSAYPDLAKVEDWLNAKGYTGEAGACHNAMDKIREQARRIAELEAQWSQDVLFENCEYRSEAGWDRLRARIAELEAGLRPFAELDAHWAGDKMPLQPKSVMLNPLPILYAIKALKND